MYQNRYIIISELIYVYIMFDTNLERTLGINYKILKLFLIEPVNEINLASVVKRSNMNKMTAYRSLEKMVKTGILRSRSDKYRKYYKLINSPIISTLKVMTNVDSPIVTNVLKNFGSRSRLIILYGSRANGTNVIDSDWDFIVVSDELNEVTINKTISDLETKYDCQINIKH